jgi:hypothetical protein
LVARWALQHQEEVAYCDSVVVVRLPRSGIVVQFSRGESGAHWWLDAGRGAFAADVRQVVTAIARELEGQGSRSLIA